MAFTVTHLSGAMEADPPLAALPGLLDELSTSDAEHTDVAVSHDSGWTASVFGTGVVVYEQIEDDDAEGPRHVVGLSRDETLAVLSAVAEGRLDEVEALDWVDGY